MIPIPERHVHAESSQDYIDRLKRAHKRAERRVKFWTNIANNAQVAFDDVDRRLTNIKEFFDRIEKTNDLSKGVKRSLHRARFQAGKICRNTGCTVHAIEHLVLDVKNVSECTEVLKMQVKDLVDRIGKLNDPILDKNRGIYGHLSKLQLKMGEAMTLVVDMINKTLDLLKAGNHLDASVCDDSNGLEAVLNNMLALLATGNKPGLEASTIEPVHGFPMDNAPNNDYYDKLKVERDNTQTEYDRKQSKLTRYKRYLEMATSRRDATKKALDAAVNALKN